MDGYVESAAVASIVDKEIIKDKQGREKEIKYDTTKLDYLPEVENYGIKMIEPDLSSLTTTEGETEEVCHAS